MKKMTIEKGKAFIARVAEEHIKAADFAIGENLQMKMDHSERVAANCRYLAEALNLDDESTDLIELIGLLHDVGRFAQFRKYQHFDDSKSEDHAVLSVDLIAEQEFFQEMDETDQMLLREVIAGHNEPKYTSNDPKALQFGQILRDADKMDNWKLAVSKLQRDGTFSLPSISYNLPKMPGASDKVLKNLLAGKTVEKKDLETLADYKLFSMSLVYDLNFKASFVWVTERQLIQKLYESMTKGDRVIDAYRQIRLHIENRLSSKEMVD